MRTLSYKSIFSEISAKKIRGRVREMASHKSIKLAYSVYVMWKQPFLLSAGSRKPFNLLMCNCAASQGPGTGDLAHSISCGKAPVLLAQLTCFFSANFWPTFNSGKRVKSKVVLSFRERAAKEKQKHKVHTYTNTRTYTHSHSSRNSGSGRESCDLKAATFIYFSGATP